MHARMLMHTHSHTYTAVLANTVQLLILEKDAVFGCVGGWVGVRARACARVCIAVVARTHAQRRLSAVSAARMLVLAHGVHGCACTGHERVILQLFTVRAHVWSKRNAAASPLESVPCEAASICP